MKKRVLSALMAVGLACSLVVTAFATADVSATPAPTAAVESQNTETESSDPAAEADPTETPAETPAATQEPTPAPEESTPAPSEEPASSATPEPTAEPSAAPDDTVTATPTPTPEATTAPTPEATEEPAAAEPTAEPEATAEPAETETQSAEVEIDGQLVNVFVDIPVGAFEEGVTPVLHAEAVSAEDADKAAETVAEQTGATFDSMMVLDVYFTDGDNTDEIEPALPVSVRFELPEAALPENIDASTLTVHHIAEEKDEAGNTVTDENGEAVVNVETVATATTTDDVEGVIALSATAAEKTEAGEDVARIDDLPELQAANEEESAAEEPAAVAEFEVESFSWFTITYNGGNAITVNLVDQTGAQLWNGEVDFSDLSAEYDPTDFGEKFIGNQWISIEELAGTWASKTEGYTYQGAYASSSLNDEIQWIRYNISGTSRWRYSTSESAPDNFSGNGELSQLYLVFDPIGEIEENENLTIQDNIRTSGEFVANYSSDTESTYYVWEKSADGDKWQAIDRQRMNGDQYNLTEDGKTLNVALEVVDDDEDIGGQWFRVSAYESRDAYETGTQPLAVSAVKQLEYYDELRNGSFEEPRVSELGTTNGNYQYPNGTAGLVWQTTGDDKQIEIADVNVGSTTTNYHTNSAAEGNQFAELNAEAPGALYQDVLTVPGTTLNWQLYHRAREDGSRGNDEDTMYLLIAPTESVEEITSQDDLENLIQKIDWNPNNYKGYYLYEISDDNDRWYYYSSNTRGAEAYTVPDGQYLTRFFFVAGDTVKDSPKGHTLGNLLDDVRFTTELLPAQPGTANLTITKTVSGLDDATMADYTLPVEVRGYDGEVVLSNFVLQSDGTYKASTSIVIENIPAGSTKEVTVTENPPTLSNYNAPSSTFAVTGENESTGDGTIATITLLDTDSGEVAFTNRYTAKEKPVPTHHKRADLIESGDNAGNYTLTLDVIGESDTTTTTSDLNVLMIVDTSASMNESFGYIDYNHYDKIGAVKYAAKQLIDTLEAQEGIGEIYYDIVQFGYYSGTETVLNWNNDSSIAKNYIDSLERREQGTNWQAGIREAINDLKEIPGAAQNAKTCVIFLTDGGPSCALKQNQNGNWEQTGSGYYVDEEYATKAANEAKGLKADYFYGIGADSDFNYNPDYADVPDAVTYMEAVINNVNATKKNWFPADDAEGLSNAFNDIAGSITNGYTSVTITDTLSKYAEFADENPDFEVTVTVGGNVVTDDEIKAGMSPTVTVDPANPKKFTWSLGENYMLKDGYTYTLSVTIKPSETAETEFASTGKYPHEPDSETGTHADKNEDGFYSNATNSANVSYKHSSWDGTLTEPYNDPVIRVQTASLTIDKNVAFPNDVTQAVTGKTFTFSIDGPDTLNGTFDGVTFASGNATVSVDGDNEKTINGLPAGLYTVTESTENVEDIGDYYFADAGYAVGTETPNYGVTNQPVTLSAGGSATVTVTNKYEKYKVVTIVKMVDGDMGDTTQPFAFTTSIQREDHNAVDIKQETVQDNQLSLWENGPKVNIELNGRDDLEGDKAHFTTDGYTLANNEKIVIEKVKKGDVFTVRETTESSAGYDVTYTASDGTSINNNGTFSVGDGDVTVTVKNTRNVVPPTGLESNHTTPYGLMVGAAGVAGAALVGSVVVRRRRRRQE